MKKLAYLSLIALCLSACIQEAEGPYDDSHFIKDVYGRTLILHGLNTASNAKCVDDHMPNLTQLDIDKEVQWGFNIVRLLTFWTAIEPDSGFYDQEYLNNYVERVNWYTDRGMYVMVDMHQDIYSCLFGGSGFPDWTIKANGIPLPTEIVTPWWLNAIHPAVEAAHRNFWEYDDYAYLQDRYLLMWQELVARVKDNPLVIGYDIMNEPHSGNLGKTFNRNFELGQLKRFYDRMVPGIRAIDPDKYLFYEPQSLSVNSGAPSYLQRVDDTRAGDPKMVYSPHCYPIFAEFGETDYDDGAEFNLALWETNRVEELRRHKTPILVGEFALRTDVNGGDQYMYDWHEMADRMQASWTYWSNDKNGPQSPTLADGSETELLNLLIRTYPQATAGRLMDYWYDAAGSREFEMTYIANASIDMPTEIFIPQRHYEGGWDFIVEGTNNWSHSWDPTRQILSIDVDEDGAEVVVKVFAI